MNMIIKFIIQAYERWKEDQKFKALLTAYTGSLRVA